MYLNINPFLLVEVLELLHEALLRSRHDCKVKRSRLVKTGVACVSEAEDDLLSTCYVFEVQSVGWWNDSCDAAGTDGEWS